MQIVAGSSALTSANSSEVQIHITCLSIVVHSLHLVSIRDEIITLWYNKQLFAKADDFTVRTDPIGNVEDVMDGNC